MMKSVPEVFSLRRLRSFLKEKGPGACPGLEEVVSCSIAAAATTAATAAVRTLVGEVPRAILRVERVICL
jgi:hypothetical protein